MGVDGQNFNCTRCHSTTLHNIAGRVYTTPASEHRKSLIEDDLAHKITCESCHTDQPHKEEAKMNDHTDKVACQSCHIPTFARVNPTKMWWDWSQAGKKKNGKPFMVKDDLGKPKYFTKKGDMRWEKNVKPEYAWFNGAMNTMTVKDTIDPAKVVSVSGPVGSAADPNSRIFPFKVHRATQPFDTVHNYLLQPQTVGEGGFWTAFDWDAAFELGSQATGIPYSGEYGFTRTDMFWPISHMVAPAGEALRPTSERAREALFDILAGGRLGTGDRTRGARVLDAFAGTGALGLEALSRGAESAVFMERPVEALAALRAELESVAEQPAD